MRQNPKNVLQVVILLHMIKSISKSPKGLAAEFVTNTGL